MLLTGACFTGSQNIFQTVNGSSIEDKGSIIFSVLVLVIHFGAFWILYSIEIIVTN
jgi:hypothetical protein